VHDLAGPWHVRHVRVLHPLDVADDSDAWPTLAPRLIRSRIHARQSHTLI
jgi:hypothetical protein